MRMESKGDADARRRWEKKGYHIRIEDDNIGPLNKMHSRFAPVPVVRVFVPYSPFALGQIGAVFIGENAIEFAFSFCAEHKAKGR